MQLFNAKSFLTPLIDKRALGVILLTAIFFAVFRLSGGTITTSPPGSVRGAIEKPVTGPAVDLEDEFKTFEEVAPSDEMRAQARTAATTAYAAKPSASRPQSLNREDLLKQITGGSTSKAREGDASNSGRKLEDIEKSLGLR